MDIIDIRDYMQRFIFAAMIVAMIWSPVYAILLIGAAALCRKPLKRRRNCGFVLGGILVICLVAFPCQDVIYLIPTELKAYLFSLLPARMFFVTLVAVATLLFNFGTADKWLVEQDDKRHKRTYIETDHLEFNSDSHTFVVGTTGSGKTQVLLRYIKDSLEKNEPLYIISGKPSTDRGSLLDDVEQMCRIYGRELVLVSFNPLRKNRVRYNPLKHMDVTELGDALTDISEFSEEHYRANLSAYIKAVAEVMAKAMEPYSLRRFVHFLEFENYKELLVRCVAERIITRDEAVEYLRFKTQHDISMHSFGRYKDMLLGVGNELFGDEDGISCSDVRDKGAVLFIDLDSFKYPTYISSFGELFFSDLRHMIATGDESSRKRVVCDEISTYASKKMSAVFGLARTYEYQMIIATQSIADIRMERGEDFAHQILENCNAYVTLKLNDSSDAEEMSNIMGTRKVVETTRKSQGTHLHLSKEGSKKIVHEYKVPVDDLKELPNLQMFVYDKAAPDVVRRVTLRYGWNN